MAEHDLTASVAAWMDPHLVLPVLEFLQERGVYADEEILRGKIRLLAGTNMVDYAMDIHKSLHGTDDVPADMVARRSEVVERLRALQEAVAPIVAFLSSPQLVQELHADKQYNLHMLQERHQIGPDQIEALYQYAKFQYECGMYSDAADFLSQYRALCTNSERSLSALWGKLAAEILMQNWDVAQEELNRLKEMIDSSSFTSSPVNQLHSRIWLMHWSLFIFFNHENGRNGIIDLFFQDRYLNAIQTNAPHLLRYLAAAVVVNKRRRNMLKELIKVIQQEQNSYKDPIIEFLECLYVKYDFDGAQQKLVECEQVILNDPFLGKRVEERNGIAVPLRDEFLENARLFIFETYCRIHRCIDIGVLAEKLNMTYDEAELWIMNMVKSSKLDAKIDSVTGTLIMTTNRVDVHEQIIESMKNLNARTYMLAKSVVDPGHAAAQQAARFTVRLSSLDYSELAWPRAPSSFGLSGSLELVLHTSLTIVVPWHIDWLQLPYETVRACTTPVLRRGARLQFLVVMAESRWIRGFSPFFDMPAPFSSIGWFTEIPSSPAEDSEAGPPD
uniref:Eukaryotic translation initiation factor 3 subunit E n=2 Tax=Aegilops tauschii TaxID=37682 RepID=M8AZD7_AEGTA